MSCMTRIVRLRRHVGFTAASIRQSISVSSTATSPRVVQELAVKNPRLFSTIPQRRKQTPSDKDSDASKPVAAVGPLPTRHSVNQPPPVCRDSVTNIVATLEADILNAPIGSLIPYRPVDRPKKLKKGQKPINVAKDREIAWDTAYETVQKVEFLLRGLAAQLPGTLTWKQQALRGPEEYWAAASQKAQPPVSEPQLEASLQDSLPIMTKVIHRLNEEGLAYMQVRAQRLQELYPTSLPPGQAEQDEDEAMEKLWASADVAAKDVDQLLTDGGEMSQQQQQAGTPQDMKKMLGNKFEMGSEEEFRKEVDLKDFDGLSPQELTDLQTGAGGDSMRESVERSEHVMKESGFRMGEAPFASSTPDDSERRNKRLTAEQLQFLGFMAPTTSDSATKDTKWSQLSKEQQQMLEFLACSSPTMSEEKEEELLQQEKTWSDYQDAKEWKAKQPKPDPFKVPNTRYDITPLEDEEKEKEEKKQKMLNLLETYDDGLTDEERQLQEFENQFASPGATVDMYNLVLDCMAVTAANVTDPYTLVYHTDVLHPRNVEFFFEQAICRHELDGGDGTNYFLPRNDNVYTVPNIVTFNAPLRLCSSLPYEAQQPQDNSAGKSFLDKVSSFMDPTQLIYKMQRDEALVAAMFTFDRLTHCRVVRWSPASFAYMIKLCGKYLPAPSEMRGNVSVALFANCLNEGLVDGFVLREIKAANDPSNSSDVDEWFAKHGVPMPNVEKEEDESQEDDKKFVAKELAYHKRQDLARQYGKFSPKWTRFVRPRRYLDYDSTY